MDKLVSICLATYNGSCYIKEQLDSLCNQTHKNIEILIQDDASTDNTVDIVKKYQKTHTNIKLFENKTNIGYIKNFETLLQKAQGDYIAPCDQDDIWLNNKIELLLNNIGSSSLIYANSALIDSNGNPLEITLQDKLKNNFINSQNLLNFLYDNSVSAHAMLFEKKLLHVTFPFPKHIYFDIWIAMIAANHNGVIYLDTNLVLYRQHSNNTLGNVQKKQTSTISKISQKVQKKEKSITLILKKIDEVLQMQQLSEADRNILQTLKSYYAQFDNKYFNIPLFFFLLSKKDILFAITKKSPLYIAFKHAIGKKLYRIAPFL